MPNPPADNPAQTRAAPDAAIVPPSPPPCPGQQLPRTAAPVSQNAAAKPGEDVPIACPGEGAGAREAAPPSGSARVPTLPRGTDASIRIRNAGRADLGALVRLETLSFDTDRLTRRHFRHMLTRGRARTLLAVDAEEIALGYVMVLFSRATSVARLYSIAVDREARGRGVGRALVAAAEEAAWEEERAYMRLEIRRDNLASQGLFEGLGYRRTGVVGDYYEDHMEAFRYEKTLAPDLKPELQRVPYYEQTLDFTCGSSSLMMAMKALRPDLAVDRKLEIRIWREATTVFMTSGHGGCGPFGLALAAYRRGFAVEVFINDPGVPLVDSVRSPEKKEVMRLVHEDMQEEIERLGIPVRYEAIGLDALSKRFDGGAVPMVLISSYRIYGEKFPHWVVVTGFDTHFVYVHDPFVDYENGESVLDSINMPIQREEFSRMARYGRAGLQAVVLISLPSGSGALLGTLIGAVPTVVADGAAARG